MKITLINGLIAFLFGLALTQDITAAFLSPMAFYLFVWRRNLRRNKRQR